MSDKTLNPVPLVRDLAERDKLRSGIEALAARYDDYAKGYDAEAAAYDIGLERVRLRTRAGLYADVTADLRALLSADDEATEPVARVPLPNSLSGPQRWRHLKDGSVCETYLAHSSRPVSGEWWCTEHQDHVRPDPEWLGSLRADEEKAGA